MQQLWPVIDELEFSRGMDRDVIPRGDNVLGFIPTRGDVRMGTRKNRQNNLIPGGGTLWVRAGGMSDQGSAGSGTTFQQERQVGRKRL